MTKFQRNTRRRIQLSIAAAAVASTIAVARPSAANTYYWDTNGTTAGFGTAGGTWGTSADWNTDATGVLTPTAATTATTDSINFGAASAALGAGTVTVGTVNSGNITFGSAAGAINLSSGTITLAAADTITTNNAADTIGSVLAGAGTSLTTSGTGTLTLTAFNTYTGATTVSGGGTLLLATSSANGNTNSYGSLIYNINGASALTLNGSRVNFSGVTFAFDSTGGGSINALTSSFGGVVLTGADTFTTSGGAQDTIAGSAGLNMNATGAIFNVAKGANATADLVVSANLWNGAATVTKNGAGTMQLTYADTYTGTTTINGGTLQVGNGTTGSLNGTTGTALTFGGAGAFNVDEANASGQKMTTLTFSAGDGTVQSTYGTSGTTTLTFATLAARPAGATENFISGGAGTSGGTASTNKIVLTSTTNAPLSTGSNNQGVFFGGGNYARYDTTNNYFRAVIYGADTNAPAAIAGGATIGTTTAITDVQITGAITAQTAASVNTINDVGSNNVTISSGTLALNGLLESGGISTISGGTGITTTASGNELVIRTNLASDSLTLSAPILANGASALTVSGAGTLTLSSTASTYTGVTYLNAGITNIAGDTSLGTAPTGSAVANQLTFNGGTLQFNSAFNLATLRGITLNAGGGTIDTQAFTSTYAGVVAGSGALTKIGAGTLALSGANSYSGGTFISAGTLSLNYTGTSTISALGTGPVVNNATLTFGDSGGGNVLAAGNTLTGTGSLTGSVAGGTIGILGSVNQASVSLTSTEPSSVQNVYGNVYGAAINLYNNVTTTGNQSYTGIVSIAGAPLNGTANPTTTLTTTGGGSSVTITGGVVSGVGGYWNAGTLNINTAAGNGPVSLAGTGANLSYGVGNLNVNSGTATTTLTGGFYGYDYSVFSSNVALTANSNFQENGGAQHIDGLQFLGSVTGSAFTLTVAFTGGAASSSGTGRPGLYFTPASAATASVVIAAGSAALTMNGSGSLTLSGANSYSGVTTIDNGTLIAGTNSLASANGAFGNAATAIALGDATSISSNLSPSLLINGAFTVGRAITVGSATTATTGVYTLGASNTTGTATFSGSITLNQPVILAEATGGTVEFKTGTWTTANDVATVGSAGNTGTVKLTNSLVTTGGVNINYGTLLLGTANALGGSTTPVTVGGGTLDLNNLADTVGAFAISSGTLQSTGGTQTLTASSYALQGGTIASSTSLGGAGTTVTVSSGTTTLNGAEAGTTVNINSGTLKLGSSNVLASGATVTLGLASSASVGTLDLNGTSQSITALATTGTAPGSQIVTSSTSGAVLTLTGNTTYAGQINGGANLGLSYNGSGNTLTLTGTSSYTGATTLTAGTLNLNGGTLGNTAVMLSSGSTLTNTGLSTGTIGGTLAAPGSTTISLTSGIASTGLSVTGGITLGTTGVYSSNHATLTYTLGASNAVETLATPGTLTINSGGAYVNISNPTNAGTYTLATYASPLAGSGGFSLSSTTANVLSKNFGREVDTLTVGSTSLTLAITGAPVPDIAYWDGAVSSVWNDTITSSTLVNWSTDSGGASDAGNTPGIPTDVILNASNQTGTVSTTLGASTTINTLTVNGNGTNTVATDGSTLTINAAAGSFYGFPGPGITISGANAFTINTPIVMGSGAAAGTDQTWSNGSSGTFTVGVASAGTTITGSATAGNTQNLFLANTSTGATIINDAIGDGVGGGKLAVSLNDDGAGMTLAGVNSYTGATTLSSGTLSLTGTLGFGASGGTAISTAGTFTESITGVIAGTSSLSVTGGTTTLGGVNTYNGTTSVSGGTLSLTNTIGSGSGTAISSSATFTEGSAGVIAGTSSLSVTGGTTTLGGVNTYTGTTSVSSTGTLSLTNTIGSGAGTAISSAATLTEGSAGVIAGTSSLAVTGGTTTLAGTNTYTGATSISSTGTLSLTGSVGSSPGHTAISSAGAFNESSGGIIAGTSSVAVTGGTTTLAGNNTYSGGTSLSAGTLDINSSGTSGTNSAIGTGTLTLSGGAIDNTSLSLVTLATNNPMTWTTGFAFTGTGNLNLGTGTVTVSANPTAVTVNGGTLTAGGTINGTGQVLRVLGAGTLSLTGALNTYLDIDGGTVTTSGGGTIYAFNLGNGAASQTSTFTQTAGTITMSTTTNAFSNAAAASTAIWNMSNGTLNGGSGGNWYGNNTTGASTTYNWSGGTANWLTNGFLVAARGSSTMNLTGTSFNVGIMSLGLWTGEPATVVVNLDANSALSAGYIGEVTTSGFAPGSESAVSSTFNFNGGQLSPRSSVTNFLQYVDTVNVQNGGAIINTAGYNITIPNALLHYSGATTDSLTKSGLGTLTLTAANTYGGGTTVSAGTLLVNNSSSSTSGTGTGPVVVNAAGALGGSGFISGAATINGIIAAGASSGAVGTLTDSGGQTWNSGATYSWKVATAGAGSAGTNWDLLQLTGGTLALDGAASSYTIAITRSGAASSGGVTGNFEIVDATAITNFIPSEFVISDPSNGAGGTFDTWTVSEQSDGNGGMELELTGSTPEPGSLGLLGLASLGLLRRRRRWPSPPFSRRR